MEGLTALTKKKEALVEMKKLILNALELLVKLENPEMNCELTSGHMEDLLHKIP